MKKDHGSWWESFKCNVCVNGRRNGFLWARKMEKWYKIIGEKRLLCFKQKQWYNCVYSWVKIVDRCMQNFQWHELKGVKACDWALKRKKLVHQLLVSRSFFIEQN